MIVGNVESMKESGQIKIGLNGDVGMTEAPRNETTPYVNVCWDNYTQGVDIYKEKSRLCH